MIPNTVNAPAGILLVSKPAGLTSFDVVHRVKRHIKAKKTGHCGTLDPAAEGLLVVLFGKATKLQGDLTGQDKVYRTVILLGVKTDTQDTTGKTLEEKPVPAMDKEQLLALLEGFRGRQIQEVPAYSAVKYKGKRLYEYARAGIETVKPKREVDITAIDLLSFNLPRMELRIACSCGTYIRSLADAIGARIGCGGTMEYLYREKSGQFDVKDAVSLAELEQMPEEKVIELGERAYERFCGNNRHI